MADQTRGPITEATVGLAEESRDYLNRLTNAWTQATQQWIGAAQQFQPTFSTEGYTVPNPKEFIDASFDIAEQVLGFQRQLAHQVIDRFGSLATDDDTTAPEKFTQQVNETAQRVSQQLQQAQQQAQQQVQKDAQQAAQAAQGSVQGAAQGAAQGANQGANQGARVGARSSQS